MHVPHDYNGAVRSLCMLVLGATVALVVPRQSAAQVPPPPIGHWVVDARVQVPRFPQTTPLAASRGVNTVDLPGTGLGAQGGAHVFLLRLKGARIGVGAEATQGWASHNASPLASGLQSRATSARLTTLAGTLSANFGSGAGWSYISAGGGSARWSLVPTGAAARAADQSWVTLLHYGGGARWDVRPHVAFTADARFYVLGQGVSDGIYPGPLRTRLLVIGAGLAVH